MEQTTNYGLNKPGGSDYARIDVLNANMDAVDAALKELEESKAEGAALAEHEADGVKHVTAAERTAWNAKADGDHTHTAAQVGAVPTTRKVNGKALSADITLTAADVGAAAASHSHGAGDIASGTLDADVYKRQPGGIPPVCGHGHLQDEPAGDQGGQHRRQGVFGGVHQDPRRH